MRVELGGLVPALEGWVLCVDEYSEDCAVCVELPEWARRLGEAEKLYLALYLAARSTMDYRVAAAMHIHSIRSRAVVRPELLARALRESKVASMVPRSVEDDSPYAWEAVLYRGILYAQALLDLDKPIVVKVEPPRDKRERERLRVLLEGKRVTVKGKTYHVGSLVKRLGGERLAPWTYIVPKSRLPALAKAAKGLAGEVKLVHGMHQTRESTGESRISTIEASSVEA